MSAPLLEVRELDVAYGAVRSSLPLRRERPRTVVRDVSLSLSEGETLALVGESGSGKTTIARTIAGLLTPVRGEILFEGRSIDSPVGRRSHELLRQIQYIFQNPDSSLNPRRRVGAILGRPLELFFGLSGPAKRQRIEELLSDVHLDPRYARRFPRQLSGGERQRVAIAQALAAGPKLILCDEIVSALDVSVQATILDLLRELQVKRKIAYAFIAHDLAVVRWLADRVVVLYRGQIMEEGTSAEVFLPPFHPYTEVLLRSVPEPDPASSVLGDDLAASGREVADLSVGCPFAAVCRHSRGPTCEHEPPPIRRLSRTHAIRCHIDPAELASEQSSLAVEG